MQEAAQDLTLANFIKVRSGNHSVDSNAGPRVHKHEGAR